MIALKDGADLRLAEYQPELLEALVPMWRQSFEFGVGVTDSHPLAEQRDYFLTRVLPSCDVHVALLDGVLVGFAAANCESLSQLYVRVGYHGRGIGSSLLEWAKRQSDGSLWLYTFERNVIARRFYECHGFTATQIGFESMWQLNDVRYEWSEAAHNGHATLTDRHDNSP